jgi:hypothetical protein
MSGAFPENQAALKQAKYMHSEETELFGSVEKEFGKRGADETPGKEALY